MEKTRQFQFFMTVEDEAIFCEKLREYNTNILFLDTSPSPESDIDKRLFKSVADSSSPFFSIVNFDLLNKDELSKRYQKYSEYLHFCDIAKEQIQFLRSKPDPDNIQTLRNGRLADSYDSEDEEEKKWKNKVYSILKKLGEKVYWYYHTPDGSPEINVKPQSGMVAFPDALQKYNGRNGNFMKWSNAKFVGTGTTIKDLVI